MHRLRPRLLNGLQDAGHVQVGFRRGRGTDADGLVGKLHKGGLGVGRAVNGDRLDAEVVAGAGDALRDFAAIGNEDLVKGTLLCGQASECSRCQPGRWPCQEATRHRRRELSCLPHAVIVGILCFSSKVVVW